ncbi:Glycine dehydrogenase (decarboxylating), mitochondrial [Galdieria sulphuraria]|nr:Glycine dehydrogenase (decarboxylating), mitochondrial [Galdieria sulphuraria]
MSSTNHRSYSLLELKVSFKDKFVNLLQYPTTQGIIDYENIITEAHHSGAKVIMSYRFVGFDYAGPSGEMHADFAVVIVAKIWSATGYGGPHAAFFATKDEYKRLM